MELSINEERISSRRSRHAHQSRCCCMRCNSQICCSYLLSLIASLMVIGGVYIAYKQWDRQWLIVSGIGISLIFVGSCFYYSGNAKYYQRDDEYLDDRSRRKRRRFRSRGRSNDQLMPTAPPLNQSRSVSQFSLNMIPQYFSAMDTESIASNLTSMSSAPQPKPFSQIFNVNGQSFLILPLSSGETINSINNFPMQNLVLKIHESNIETQSKKFTMQETQKFDPKQKPMREEQGCQTEQIKPNYNVGSTRRDVQLQTLPHDEVSRNISLSTQSSAPLLYHTSPSASSSSSNQISDIRITQSEEICVDLEPFETRQMTESNNQTAADSIQEFNRSTNMPLIDFGEDISNENPSEHIHMQSFDISENINNSIIHECICADDILFNESYDFTNENNNDGNDGEDMENHCSTPPPSYEEVLDDGDAGNGDTDDSSVAVVNYGTL